MRLFIAINFERELKDKLSEIINNFKNQTVRGNFTKHENLHLTLVFVGETDKIEEIKKAMDNLEWRKFNLAFTKPGRFKRSGGDIYWLGIQDDDMLSSVNAQLTKSLSEAGFKIESREFKPHLTLGREVVLSDNFNIDEFSRSIPNLKADIDRISLMRSQHMGGKLVYTEIYSVSAEN